MKKKFFKKKIVSTAYSMRIELLIMFFLTPMQGSPTVLKLRATACVPINAKGYKFVTNLWNKNFAQFTFNYFSIDIP